MVNTITPSILDIRWMLQMSQLLPKLELQTQIDYFKPFHGLFPNHSTVAFACLESYTQLR
jgi:hypothetical protein